MHERKAERVAEKTEAVYCLADCETTGVDALNDRIIQLVVATADVEGNVLECWEWFINPDVPVPDEAAEVHGFSNEYLAENGRPAAEVFAEAIGVFREHWKLIQVQYNMNFDLTFLDAEFKRWGIADNFGAGMSEYTRLYDCYVTDRACDKYRKGKRKLLNLADYYGISYNEDELHNALADVTLTAKVAVAVRNKYGLPTNQQQADWHRSWAENFRDYLRRNGKTEEEVAGVSGDWPLRKEN